MGRAKIDVKRMMELLREGKLQKDVAKELGVSPAAITKKLQRLSPPVMPESFQGLTEKEKNFVIEKAKGKTATDAVMRSYDCVSRESAKVLGSNLMAQSKIQQSIADLLDQVGLTKLYRMEKLKTHVDSQDPVIGLKALDMSFHLDGYKEAEVEKKPQIIINIDERKLEYINKGLEDIKRLVKEGKLAMLEDKKEELDKEN